MLSTNEDTNQDLTFNFNKFQEFNESEIRSDSQMSRRVYFI